MKSLLLSLRFIQSFNRGNLRYEVIPKKGKSCTKDVIDLINSKFKRQSGIVYCLSRYAELFLAFFMNIF